MIVDTKGVTIDVTLVFERPPTPEMQAKLDYILDTISELESDYDFDLEDLG